VLGLIAEGPLFLSHKTWLQYAEQKRLRWGATICKQYEIYRLRPLSRLYFFTFPEVNIPSSRLKPNFPIESLPNGWPDERKLSTSQEIKRESKNKTLDTRKPRVSRKANEKSAIRFERHCKSRQTGGGNLVIHLHKDSNHSRQWSLESTNTDFAEFSEKIVPCHRLLLNDSMTNDQRKEIWEWLYRKIRF
jgi:hypothetical protein